ncbi:hypothetical protein RUMCAL_01891 [Ruminococcus callidus ATCC 27760]|uniref:Uncharacterized protein n=1 Tax=Ruminococcus callidus ATCC 27760 TaxID=411473 RepID=U2KR92_9FIRM|nr:hypothetical protein RUMCAL_01891 [Ruminococcus callidus ATCC 27760]
MCGVALRYSYYKNRGVICQSRTADFCFLFLNLQFRFIILGVVR